MHFLLVLMATAYSIEKSPSVIIKEFITLCIKVNIDKVTSPLKFPQMKVS